MYPASILRQKARPVPEVTDEVRAVALRMVELMREAEGIGLAANQVGLPWRLFVADVPPTPAPGADGAPEDGYAVRSASSDPPTASQGPQVFINPSFLRLEGELEGRDEGCLSLPDITGEVRRPPVATITALDLDGEPITLRAAGLLARCWQHETDHLDGVLIIDRMIQSARLKNRAAVRDLERSADDARSR